MKKSFLLFLALFPLLANAQIAGGSYVIPSPAYPTLASAITALNASGISGNVTFLIDADQTTTSTYTINQFTGSSQYTTTFKPNTGKTITISGNIQNGALIALAGADRIVFDGNNGVSDKKMTLFNTHSSNTYDSRAVVWMYDTATYNTVKNLIVRATIAAVGQGSYVAGVITGSSTMGDGGSNNPYGTITNNTFTSVSQAVFINGNNANNNRNWTVTDNLIGSANDNTKPFLGIMMENVNNFVITGNTLDGIKHSSTSGSNHQYSASAIYVNVGSNGTISGNTITNVANSTNSGRCFPIYANAASVTISQNAISNVTSNGSSDDGISGIWVSGANATIFKNTIYSVVTTQAKLNAGIYLAGSNGMIYNNMISNIVSAGGGNPSSQSGTGIYIYSGSSTKVYFNSVRMATNQSGGVSSCLFINGGSSLDVRNNSFYNLQTSGAVRFAVYFESTSAVQTLNANNYYSSQHIGSYGSYYTNSNIKTTFANWKAATGKDAVSISVIPPYTSATDLHLSASSSLDGAGIAISGITDDIDGDMRSAAPTIGADERKCGGLPTTWNGSSWNNGAPTGTNASPSTQRAIIAGDYPASGPSFRACELTVNSGKTLNIGDGKNVVVEYDITINGSLLIDNGGSLSQVSDTALNTGNITLKRNTTALKQYDYTYWSSPVAGATLAATVNNGPTACYAYDGAAADWTYLSTSTVMEKGKGYISRAPNNLTFPNTGYTATFTGNPNTGVVPVTVYKTPSQGDNLIGNPYPSALNADAFILANRIGTGTINQTIDGNLYFWTHTLAISATNPNPGSGTYAYSADDYAVYNMSGGTRAALSQTSSPVQPNGYIAAGQSFFVTVGGSPGTKTVTFNNSMRIQADGQNGQFFRSANPQNATESAQGTIEKHRIWLNLSNIDGAFKQMLLAYVTGATNDYDYGFDGVAMDAGNYVSLYSILGDKKLVIQGRDANFSTADVVPLGLTTSIAGTFEISIDQVDGLFEAGQSVYLLDKLTNTLVNLSDQKYEFQTAVGTFDDRFELRFSETALGVNLPPVVKHSVSVFTSNGQIEVSATQDIQSVVVYDLTGRQLFSKTDVNSREFSTGTLPARNQIVIAKVTAADGSERIKKLQIR